MPTALRRMRFVVVGTLAATAFVVSFPFRVWWRARRNRTSLAVTLEAMAAEAYERMPPEMRAEIDHEREDAH